MLSCRATKRLQQGHLAVGLALPMCNDLEDALCVALRESAYAIDVTQRVDKPARPVILVTETRPGRA
jgi:hypothetical protein